MKKDTLRKKIVYILLLLLIGLNLSSCVYGTNIESSPFHQIVANNYILAYWKFDEGSGDTAYDSSGHDFDGLINGASWTTGYKGYALEFDGVDDFVGLDDYAKHLGFNKTDDLIYSFLFKSSGSGLIYCLSSQSGTNPEHFVELLPNGTLRFKVWTNYCGIQLDSDKTYNDNKWYHAEYYFNGITANPTVELYVNGVFDNDITEWLCAIENDDYAKAKIGRHSKTATNFYTGKLDEFKITKYPGGNKQTPPEIDGPISGEVGEELTYTFVSYDPEKDNISYYIKWGNGKEKQWFGPFESGEEINESITYYEEGEFTITAKVKDYWDDSFWNSFTVRIGNEKPHPPQQPTGPMTGDAGIEYSFSSSTIDPDNDTLEYFWSWGDGNTSGWIGEYESGEMCTANYSWVNGGDYNITVKARDKYGESNWSDPLQIHITEPIIHISKISGGLFTIKADIENSGDGDAKKVDWIIDVPNALIPKNPHWEGTIDLIPPGDSETIASSILLGLGESKVIVTAEIDEKTSDNKEKNALILLFFILIR
jgi:hypothetical protein